MKGIILAGGSGTRLRPLTKITSKQLLPIYNKPMIFYPVETLVKAGITDILVIVAPERAGDFLNLLGTGKEFGCKFTYEIQEKPEGLAQAFILGESFVGSDKVALILGDNLYEDDFSEAVNTFESGARIFAYEVPDPERYGVVEFDDNHKVISIVEKPEHPKSNFCVTGFYIYDNSVIEKAKNQQPSPRGELEITDLNMAYLREGTLDVSFVKGRWLDTGTFEAMYEAITFAREKALAEKKE